MKIRRVVSKRRNSPGFTLLELIIATSLSSIVLMGMFSIMSNMVSAEMNGMRNGTVTAYSIAGITAMNTDISGSGAIGFPASGGTSNSLVVCTNWSTKGTTPGVVQSAANGGTGNTVYSYCWDTTDLPNALLRNVTVHGAGGEACPAAPLAPCTMGAYGNAVVTGVYQDPANLNLIFYTDPLTMNAVRMRYIVGNPNANLNSAGGSAGQVTAMPVSVPFNTEILLED
jgi:prepilin-type N-terminal cleavage/methylation domain-containing protein